MVQSHSLAAVKSTGISTSSGRDQRPSSASSALTRLGTAIEICLGLAILIPPFIFGGREAWGQLALAALVLATSGLWIIRRSLQGPKFVSLKRPEIFLVLAAFTLLVISWIPLPAGMVRTAAPGIGRLLPGWENGALSELNNGCHTLSLTPGLSIEGMFLFALYALLFWITLDVVRTRESARRLLVTLFVTGIGVASVGLLHYLFWSGKFYGLWTLWWVEPDRHVRAPFTNRNHFAGFLALAVAPALITLFGLFRRWKNSSSFGSPSPRRPHELLVLSAGFGVVLIFAGLFLSQSRGGMIVGVLAAAATTAGLFRAGINRASSLALVLLLVAGGIGIVVAAAGQEPFQRSAAMLASNQSLDDLSNQRFRLWKADLQALGDFPLFGTGAGSHAQVYPLYLENAHHLTFTHAESGYVQVLVECGLAGGILLLLGIGVLGRCCWRGLRTEAQSRERSSAAIVLAVSVSLLVALVHGVVDFVWYVPAYAAAMAVLAGLACSAYRNRAFPSVKRESTTVTVSAPSPGKWAWGLALIAFWAIISLIVARHFVNQVRVQRAWNAYFELLPETDQEGSVPSDIANTQQRIDLLAETCRSGSGDTDHYYRLGLANLELFAQKQARSSGSLSLAEAHTYLGSEEFRDRAVARAWLTKVYGGDLDLLENARSHFHRSLQCCPLNGQSYVRLAQLCFLDGTQPTSSQLHYRQALLVRPYDPDVHLQVGLEAWTAGDLPCAQLCWGKACRWQSDCKWKVLPIVAEQLPAEQAADFLPLDFDALKWLARNQLALNRKNGLNHVIEQAQRAVEADPELGKSANAWLALHELYQEAGLEAPAETSVRRAIQLAPREAGYQLRLIQWQIARGRWDDALEQAQTARRSFPLNTELQNLLRNILIMKDPASAPKKPKLHSASKPP